MNKDSYQEYRLLQKHGIDVQEQDQIRPNSGSETLKHGIAKCIVAHIGLQHDYSIGSEVNTPGGQVDILLWGNPSRQTLVVECETSPEAKTMQSKHNRYVRGPIDDMLSINVSEMPVNYLEAQAFVREELGL